MTYDYDIAVVGGGLLGCFTARSLSRYRWKIGVFEKNLDVCAGISRANTAIIYPGYDVEPGSLKARLCLSANENFESLCAELNVRFRRRGSLMVSFGPRGDGVLRSKYNQGVENGVKGMWILSGREVIEMEPNINPAVTGALYTESTATVNPWELGIAAAECAATNGVEMHFGCGIDGINVMDGGYSLVAGDRSFTARAIVNCAGLYADKISEMLNKPRLRLQTSAADYLILDPSVSGFVRHIIMHEPEVRGKGATLVPTIDGNLLIGPSDIKRDNGVGFETDSEGLDFVRSTAGFVFPGLPIDLTIRSFGSARPYIKAVAVDELGNVSETGERIRDLSISMSEENPGFISLIGIKTPGLTCCSEIGGYVAEMLLDFFGNPGEKADYSPCAPKHVIMSELDFESRCALAQGNADYGKIVCRCMKATEGEIRDAIRRSPGAVTLDGVKRRTGAQMGRCQGGFCTLRIMEILAEELGVPVSAVLKDAPNSVVIKNEKI